MFVKYASVFHSDGWGIDKISSKVYSHKLELQVLAVSLSFLNTGGNLSCSPTLPSFFPGQWCNTFTSWMPHLSLFILWICIGKIICQTPSDSELPKTWNAARWKTCDLASKGSAQLVTVTVFEFVIMIISHKCWSYEHLLFTQVT